jgi:2-oxoisovalerate dehydrogenase E1 component alpha subunit
VTPIATWQWSAILADGATSQGDVNEAFIFASSYNPPIVFFCQNNQ